MNLEKYSSEQLQDMSLVELAKLILLSKKEPIKFKAIFEEASTLKQLTEAEKEAKLSQFYTDLNVDGNFTKDGSNTWGLKSWYRTKTNGEAKVKPRKRIKKAIAPLTDDKTGDDELDMIDETIDAVEYDELTDELDDDLGVDFSEEDDFFEEDSY